MFICDTCNGTGYYPRTFMYDPTEDCSDCRGTGLSNPTYLVTAPLIGVVFDWSVNQVLFCRVESSLSISRRYYFSRPEQMLHLWDRLLELGYTDPEYGNPWHVTVLSKRGKDNE